jgi:hypothetical protein
VRFWIGAGFTPAFSSEQKVKISPQSHTKAEPQPNNRKSHSKDTKATKKRLSRVSFDNDLSVELYPGASLGPFFTDQDRLNRDIVEFFGRGA